ncbi:hypothetical protein MMC07_007905 [Pseudocyphellaria aurata]|nr:hypothetical protein [Pseudocyphellaria aurata]
MAGILSSTSFQIIFFGSISYCLYRIYWSFAQAAAHRRLSKEHRCEPVKQVVAKDPIFGLDEVWTGFTQFKEHVILESTHRQFADMKTNTFRVSVLRQPLILTIEPQNLKTILSLNFKSWGLREGREKSLGPLLGEGIFMTDGASWQHSRDMLRPNFVRSQIGDLPMFETHVKRLTEAIPRDGSTVDLQGLFYRLSLDIATDFLFGESSNSLAPDASNDNYTTFVKSFDYCQNPMEDSGMFEFVDALVEKSLPMHASYESKKVSSEAARYVFLHELVSQTSDKVKIRHELLNILLAGRDTTAALLSNVWFELSRRPEVLARLREDVDALDGEIPSLEQLKNMKYLRAVLNESLRLFPIVPQNSRQALEDTILPVGGGKDGSSPIFVPKGHYAAWDLYSMHRRRDLYGEDADLFKPERWLDQKDRKGLRVGWEFLPFNGGPRICLGQQFALTEVSYTTIRLLQEFSHLESRDPEPWRERMTLVCSSLGGCKVALLPRTVHQ